MRFLTVVLVTLLVVMQFPLWNGERSWRHVRALGQEVAALQEANRKQAERNAALAAEVRDLDGGRHAIEERARYELGMVRADEIFVQVNVARSRASGPVQTARSSLR